jgi:DUF4097 and DUF4098 domain-containing protein YvlB
MVPNPRFNQDTLAIEYRMPYRSLQELVDNGKVKTLTLRIPPEIYVPINITTVTATVTIDEVAFPQVVVHTTSAPGDITLEGDFEETELWADEGSITVNGELQK